jgi:hypothetical protein
MSIPEVFPRTPTTAAMGPKARALLATISEYDDFYGILLDVLAEARAPLEAEIERLRAVLDAAADWETYYGDIDTDGKESWMTQLDHGHEEYKVRITVMAALRAALREDPTP